MLNTETAAEFVPGGLGVSKPLRCAPPGLPSLIPSLTDPVGFSKKFKKSARPWKHSVTSLRSPGVKGWIPVDAEDGMDEECTEFTGEEALLPDHIPDDLWQTHFRQHDAELNDRKETEYLLSLYKDCSGRWPVIYDRWQTHRVYGLRGKSIESLKSRFNKVVMKLLEIDILQTRKPEHNIERMQVLQSLRFLPIFSIKYNEKNEYLRRIFLENSLKRQHPDALQEKALAEVMRVPNLTMKKRSNRSQALVAPGTVLASSNITNIQTEVSPADMNRIKAMLKSLGIDREDLSKTPKIGRLLATIEKETHTLIMMRDSLQRKKQELEILKSTGANGSQNQSSQRIKQLQPATPPINPTHNAHTVLMEAAAAAASASMQQKRKR